MTTPSTARDRNTCQHVWLPITRNRLVCAHCECELTATIIRSGQTFTPDSAWIEIPITSAPGSHIQITVNR